MRAEVAARVNYDPFSLDANKTLVARLSSGEAGDFVARIRLVDTQGAESGTRELHTDGPCAELLDPMALTIAIAIDPMVLLPRPFVPPPPPPVPPALEPPPRTPEPPPPRSVMAPSASPILFDALAGAVASGGVAPSIAAGGMLGASARRKNLSLSLEGRIDAANSAQAQGGGSVTSWLAVATVAPCDHLGPVFVCGIVQAGDMHASGDAPGGVFKWVPWLAFGGRIGALVPLDEWIALRVRSDVAANPAPPTLVLDGNAVWKAPWVTESLAADLVVHFR